ncbi:SH3 domain-containing protein [Erythrobacter sp.]|jgi:SH3-like domain-containing protein|uniref:SH3 domain-containing protein n=1 Tax=Erythrobacter sp. TaxID=1042 RepID=UPI002EAA7C2B|nr:SH3 domain-containing protein [Erythrobacter sp.]
MSALRLVAVLVLAVVAAVSLVVSPASAQDRETPYWATLRFDKVNLRVGPSREYRIDWVYQRKGLPVKVVRIREGWRLVEDAEGTMGWISESQLSRSRGALIVGEGLADMREGPDPASGLRWRAEPGVVGQLQRCRDNWCEIDVAGRTGWVLADRLWGDEEPVGG